MKNVLALLHLACFILLMGSAPMSAGTLLDRTLPADSAPASRDRQYSVYIPDSLPGDGTAPLVTVLHGCNQTHRNMEAETGFKTLADEFGFAVVYPFVTSFAEQRITNCWGFWFPQHTTEGSGEVSDIRRIIAAVEEEFGTDPGQRFVTGLSSGAAMAVDMGVAYSEDIAAIGAVAGLPYGEDAEAVTFLCTSPAMTNPVTQIVGDIAAEQSEPEDRRLVPLMVIHSVNDCTVKIINGQNLRESWIDTYGATLSISDEDCTEDGVACVRSRFDDAEGRPVVETILYDGPVSTLLPRGTHFWPGDNPGEFANPNGPSASRHLWRFFQEAVGDSGAALQLAATTIEVDGTTARISGTATSDAGVTALEIGLDGDAPVPAQPAALETDGSWTVEFTGLATDQFYVILATATLGDGQSVTRRLEQFAVGDPVEVEEETASWIEHMNAGRIGLPGAGCPNTIFGTCDRDISSIVVEHRLDPFPLFARAGSPDWFVDRTLVTAGF
jgi:poly(hydroxyalkanoate) depolymerase family esterase